MEESKLEDKNRSLIEKSIEIGMSQELIKKSKEIDKRVSFGKKKI